MAGTAHLETLLRLSRSLNSVRDEQDLLAVLVQPAQERGAQRASLYYLVTDEPGNLVEMRAAAGWSAADGVRRTAPVQVSAGDYAAMTRLWTAQPDEPFVIADTAAIASPYREGLERDGTRSAVLIPLRQADRWVGLLALSWDDPHTFIDDELDLYRALVGLGAPAVENLQLLARLEETVSQQEMSLQTYRRIVDDAADGIMIADAEGVIAYANRAACELLGYDYVSREIIGLVGASFWLAEELDTFMQHAGVEPDVTSYRVEAQQRHKDGYFIMCSLTLFTLDGGRTVCFLHDISARKATEQQLRSSEQRFRMLVENLPDTIMQMDTNGDIVFANRGFPGIPAEMLIGKSLLEVTPPENQDMVRENMDAVLRGTAMHHESTGAGPDGRPRWYTTRALPVREGDLVTGMLSISSDITERKRAEMERERLQQEIIDGQRAALEELSTPIIPVMDRIIVMPLVGGIDSSRARDIMRTLLAGISEYRAEVAILDITGVPVVDTGVAHHLNLTIRAARLKGAHTIVTGMSESVAETIVDLGIDWDAIDTVRNLQTGLVRALARLGMHLQYRKM